MKTVVLCGGRGTRLNELGRSVPKALVPIGGKPILWHLLRAYASHGHTSFVLCLGYLGDMIREYVQQIEEDWKIEAVDTGLDRNTGGRLHFVRSHLPDDEPFFVTYGDGLSDVDLGKLERFHRQHGKIGTLTAVHPVSSFGILDIDEQQAVREFREKPKLKDWINGGFFVFDPGIFDHLDENSILEKEPLSRLAASGQLKAFLHDGFWKCMDTYKDNLEFQELWDDHPPWKIWE